MRSNPPYDQLTESLQKLFKRIFLTWYVKKGIKTSVDRLLWGRFQKETFIFFPNILPEPPIERSSTNCSCGKKSSKIRLKDFYIQILVLSLFEINERVTMLRKYQQKLNYLLFTTPIHYRSVMLISYVIQSYKIRTIERTFVSFCHEVFEQEGYISE